MFFPIQKGEKDKAPAVRYLEDLMQKGCGENDGTPGPRAIEMRTVFGKAQVPAFISLIKIQSEGKATMGR